MPRKREKVEPGIYRLSDGLLWLRTADRAHATTVIDVPIDSVAQGRARREQGARIRSAGGVLSVEWADWIEEQRAGRARLVGRPVQLRSRVRIEEVAEEWLEVRRRRMQTSDHTLSGLNQRGNLRPTTVDGDTAFVRAHLQHPDRLGGRYTTDASNLVVESWLIGLAEAGVQVATQEKYLNKLRHVFWRLPQSLRPDDHPWRAVEPVATNAPTKRAPDRQKVGRGRPGAKPPALLFTDVAEIAPAMRACGRVVLWLMVLMALRTGEAFGLKLRDFAFHSDARLYVTVRRQRNATHGVLDWTKANASYRTLPVPKLLEVYLRGYLDRYHGGYRPPALGDAEVLAGALDEAHTDPRADRFLCVTSTGRDVDGSFMTVEIGTWMGWWHDALDATGWNYERCGYDLEPRHLRKSWITYMLRAEGILAGKARRSGPSDPGPDAEPAQRIAYLEAQLTAAEAREAATAFHGIGVSAYAGQRYEGEDEDLPASPVSLTHYNRELVEHDSLLLELIADAVDAIASDDLPDGLLDTPDEHDNATVVALDDSDWLLIDEAATQLGVDQSSVRGWIKRGGLRWQHAYFADGDRQPPGLRIAVRAEDVHRIVHRSTNGLAFYAACEQVLHLDRSTVRRLAEDPAFPHLAFHAVPGVKREFLLRDEVAATLQVVHRGIAAALADGEAMSSTKLRRAFAAHVSTDPTLARMLRNAEKLPTKVVDVWVRQLEAVGAVRRLRNGWVRLVAPDAVDAAASAAVAGVAAFKFGRTADPENAARRVRQSARPRDARPGGLTMNDAAAAAAAGRAGRDTRRLARAADTTARHSMRATPRTEADRSGRRRTPRSGRRTVAAGQGPDQDLVVTARRCRR